MANIVLPMLCRCSVESTAEAQGALDEAMRRLGDGSDELQPVSVAPANFLTAVVTSLNWDYNAHITGIENDQWSGVRAETYDKSFSVYVECDEVEDGIAAIWLAFADRKTDDVP